MYARWTKGLTEGQEKDFKYAVSASIKVLERLEQIMDEEIAKISRERLDKNCTTSDWGYFQADCNAEERAYLKVKKLVSNLLRGK